MLYGIEKIEEILADPRILDKHVRATAGVNRLEGAGQAEAPRGTLHHHYKVDENGKITWANLVIATGQNNNAMNQGVLQAAQALREGWQVHRGHSEPRRSRRSHLRPVPELLHARLRADAAEHLRWFRPTAKLSIGSSRLSMSNSGIETAVARGLQTRT